MSIERKGIIKKCSYLSMVWGISLLIASGFFSLLSQVATGADVLKRVNIVYYINFPWHKKYETEKIKGCHRFLLHSGSAVLRCEENVFLLRPVHIVKIWQRQQSKMGFLYLTMKYFGLENVHGYIKKIQSISLNGFPLYGENIKAGAVTGRFIRHVNDVREYRFKNEKTGRISRLRSTPNHPFYVKNRGEFIPVEEISSEDEMLQKNGQIMKMNCSRSHGSHCGTRSKDSIVPVYNLEIAQKHTYFVGRDFVLVHNPCDRCYGIYRKMKNQDCYKHWFDDGILQRRYNPYRSNDTVIVFIVKAKDRDSFMWKYGLSGEECSASRIHSLILRPLENLGFVAVENRLGWVASTGEDIIMVLEDQTKFWKKLTGSEMESGFSTVYPVFPPIALPDFPFAPPPVFSPPVSFPATPLHIPCKDDPLSSKLHSFDS